MSSDEDEDLTDEVFTVEYIEYAVPSMDREGEWEYYTKWFNYDESANTLQKEELMDTAQEVVDSFWEDVGASRRKLSQYTPQELRTLKIRSSLEWREKWTASIIKDMEEEVEKQQQKQKRREERAANKAKEKEKAKGKAKSKTRDSQSSTPVKVGPPKKKGRPPKSTSSSKADTPSRSSVASTSASTTSRGRTTSNSLAASISSSSIATGSQSTAWSDESAALATFEAIRSAAITASGPSKAKPVSSSSKASSSAPALAPLKLKIPAKSPAKVGPPIGKKKSSASPAPAPDAGTSSKKPVSAKKSVFRIPDSPEPPDSSPITTPKPKASGSTKKSRMRIDSPEPKESSPMDVDEPSLNSASPALSSVASLPPGPEAATSSKNAPPSEDPTPRPQALAAVKAVSAKNSPKLPLSELAAGAAPSPKHTPQTDSRPSSKAGTPIPSVPASSSLPVATSNTTLVGSPRPTPPPVDKLASKLSESMIADEHESGDDSVLSSPRAASPIDADRDDASSEFDPTDFVVRPTLTSAPSLPGIKLLQPLDLVTTIPPPPSGANKRKTATPLQSDNEGPRKKQRKKAAPPVPASDDESSSLSEPDPLFDGTDSNPNSQPASQPAGQDVEMRDREERSSPDIPLSSNRLPEAPVHDPAPAPSKTMSLLSRPIVPQVDKHRGTKIKVLDLPLTTKKGPIKQGSTTSSRDPSSPVVPYATSSAAGPSAINPSSTATRFASPRNMDSPIGSTSSPAHSPLARTTDLAPDAMPLPPSPTVSYSPSIPTATSPTTTKGRRASAMEVTEAMDSIPKTEAPIPRPKATALPSFQATKKWNGDLVTNGKAFCKVYYEPKTTLGELGTSIRTMKELVLDQLFPAGTWLALQLPAFEPPQESGVITGLDATDTTRLDKFIAYMEHHQYVAIVRLASASAFFLLFPSSLAEVGDTLKDLGANVAIPSGPKAFMTLVMLQKRVPRAFPDLPPVPPISLAESDKLSRMVAGSSKYMRAARYFGLTAKTLDVFQDCPFSIYNAWSRANPLRSPSSVADNELSLVRNVAPEEDIETRELVALLTRDRAIEEGGLPKAYRVDWRDMEDPAPVIFVHANAWIEEDGQGPVPEFLAMRALGVRLYKFGTEIGTPSFWADEYKIEEVFCHGSVITFTADALLSDPIRCMDIIEDAGKYPSLYQVYLHPDTIGLIDLIVKEDPDRGLTHLLLAWLKDQLQKPKCPFRITYCPPHTTLSPSSTGSSDIDPAQRAAQEKWRDDQWDFRVRLAKTPELLFSTCREAMEAKHPGSPLAAPSGDGNGEATARLPLDALEQCVAETCAKDVARMQCIRTMYTSYRYFKLVHGTKGRDTPRNVRPGEITVQSIDQFDYKFAYTPPSSPPWSPIYQVGSPTDASTSDDPGLGLGLDIPVPDDGMQV